MHTMAATERRGPPRSCGGIVVGPERVIPRMVRLGIMMLFMSSAASVPIVGAPTMPYVTNGDRDSTAWRN